jgi:hypothetical protein
MLLRQEVGIIELFEQCSTINQDPVRRLECMQHGALAEQYSTTNVLTRRWLNSESPARELLTC